MKTEVYDQINELEKDHWWYKGMFALSRDQLEKYVFRSPAGSGKCTILDIGCGTGYWTEELLGRGIVIAADNSRKALAICRRRGLNNLIECSADALPISSESCDLITALGVIEHLDDDRGLAREMQRALQPGGYGVILTSAYMFLWSEHDDVAYHKRRYTAAEMKDIMRRAGLEVVKLSYVNFFMFLPVMLIRLARSIKFSKDRPSAGSRSPDLYMPPLLVNKALYSLLRIESKILKYTDLPFGISLFMVVKKSG